MIIFEQINLLREQLSVVRAQGKTVAFVPTMGHLHLGHIALINEAKKQAEIVVVSIFVNPMQFNNQSDLEHYPRTLEQDIEKLEQNKVSILFAPTVQEMYPNDLTQQSYVSVPYLSTILEGKSRPNHFDGVSTIVSKLFNIVQPDVVCFGEKDFQQLMLIKKMTVDLAYNIKVIPVATMRDVDGLAMSSRNSRLTALQRKSAPQLARIMNSIATALSISPDFYLDMTQESLINDATIQLNQFGFNVDEIFIRDADNLEELTKNSLRAVILMAAFLGGVRLIDNQVVAVPLKP